MVLSVNAAEKILEEKKKISLHQMMFLDTKHMLYQIDTLKLGWGVEILNQINLISWANKLFNDLGSDQRMDESIFYEVIEAIWNETPFNNDQLIRYYELGAEIEQFLKDMMKFMETDCHYSPYELEYFLLGMPIEVIDDYSLRELSEGYGSINCDVRFRNMEINDFIKQAKGMIAEYIKSRN